MSEEEIISILKVLIGLEEFNKISYKENKAIQSLLDLYNKEKEKYKQLFEEYNKRVATIIKYEQEIKDFLDNTNITDIEPWSEYKIKGELLFNLEKSLEE